MKSNRHLINMLLCLIIIIGGKNVFALAIPQIGSPAPVIKLMDLQSGKSFSVNDLRGKVALFNFVSAWCPSCKEAQRSLVGLADKYRGLELITISLDEDSSGFVDSLNKENPGIHFVSDKSDTITKAFAVPVLPTIYLIDQYGKIRYILPGYKPEALKKLDFFLRGLVD